MLMICLIFKDNNNKLTNLIYNNSNTINYNKIILSNIKFKTKVNTKKQNLIHFNNNKKLIMSQN